MDQNPAHDGGVSLRRIPGSYRAMLAICSDLDETPDRHVYREIMRFLNTTEATLLGPGVGLEVGNTIYFDMPPDQFAYWNTDDAGRELIRTLTRSGHIDCLHSYGDLATTRAHAGRALDELARHDCRLEVWIDHGTAPSNFGADIMRGSGDVPGSEAYHADLTCDFGVKYVWRGRVTSVIGQDVRASLGGLFTPKHPIASARTVAKEAAKNVLGRLGHAKYGMHGPNCVGRHSCLRDGRPVYEFLRCSPHFGGVGSCETGRDIGEILTDAMLNRLIKREGVCILYTHLGKIHNFRTPFDGPAIAGFRRLADAYHNGRILVLSTRRALRYLTVRDQLAWSAHREGTVLTIDVRIDESAAPARASWSQADLGGVTFYVPDGLHCRITALGDTVADPEQNPPDHTGRRSVSVPMPELTFPDV